MNEVLTGEVEPAVRPAAPTSAPRRPLWPWAVILIAGAAGGWWIWRQQDLLRDAQRDAGEWRQSTEALEARLGDVARDVADVRERQRSLDGRLTDGTNTNKVMREELLAISERAALLEDAIAQLARSREEGRLALRLDEVEFLLQMGAERLQLFDDTAGTLRAYEQADASLATMQDPLYAPLRQTLATEIATLRALPADERSRLRGELLRLEAGLAALPERDQPRTEEVLGDSAISQLLAKIVVVRRTDSTGAALTPIERANRRSALKLQLALAQAALERGDVPGWQAALQHARALLAGLFDDRNAAVGAALNTLQQLHDAPLRTVPPALGGTLQELRALRATRNAAAGAVPSVAVPAAPPAAPATAEALPADAAAEPVERSDAPVEESR